MTSIDAVRARWAVGALFLLYGILIGSWVPHIPLAKERLDAGPAVFGLALLLDFRKRLGRIDNATAVVFIIVALTPGVNVAGSPMALFLMATAWKSFSGMGDVVFKWLNKPFIYNFVERKDA